MNWNLAHSSIGDHVQLPTTLAAFWYGEIPKWVNQFSRPITTIQLSSESEKKIWFYCLFDWVFCCCLFSLDLRSNLVSLLFHHLRYSMWSRRGAFAGWSNLKARSRPASCPRKGSWRWDRLSWWRGHPRTRCRRGKAADRKQAHGAIIWAARGSGYRFLMLAHVQSPYS